MKAAALTAPGRVETVDIPAPEHGPHDVLVRMTAVGLCGTDLAVVAGARPVPRVPWVLGHEGVGEVVAVGSEVRHLVEGTTVAIEPNYCCGRCPECARGFTSGCAKRVAVGLDTPGVLAEYVSVPAQFAHPAAGGAGPRDLACAEPLAVARTAVRRSGVRAGERCLVVGAGSQGLLVCLCLLAEGVTPYVREPHEGRRALAVSLGAVPAESTGSSESAGGSLGHAVAVGDGAGPETEPASHVFETAGVKEAAAWALRHAAPGGTVTFIGMSGAPLELTSYGLVRRQLSLRGSLIYDHPRDFAETVALIGEGVLAPHRVLGGEFALADAASAFDAVGSTPGKCWIGLDGTGRTE